MEEARNGKIGEDAHQDECLTFYVGEEFFVTQMPPYSPLFRCRARLFCLRHRHHRQGRQDFHQGQEGVHKNDRFWPPSTIYVGRSG